MHFINYAAFAIVGMFFAAIARAVDEVEPPSEENVPQIESNGTINSKITPDYCEPTCFGNFFFERTRVGSVAYSNTECVEGTSSGSCGRASVLCGMTEYTGEEIPYMLENTYVNDCDFNIDQILNTSLSNYSSQEIEHIIKVLDLNTANTSTVKITKTSKVVELLENVENSARDQQLEIQADTTLRYIVTTVARMSESYDKKENLSNSNGNTDRSIQELQQKTAKLLPSLCLLSSFDKEQTKWNMEAGNMEILAQDHNLNDSKEVKYSPGKQNNENPAPVSLSLPASVMRNADKNKDANAESSTSIRTVFIYYKDNTLFPTNQTVFNILSVNVGLNESANAVLMEPIKIRHNSVTKERKKFSIPGTQLMVNETVYECVFWDFNTAAWSGKGCFLNKSSEVPECRCLHLTNFALLVSHRIVPADFSLAIASLVGCCLSIVGLLLTIFVLAYFRDLRKHRPGKIFLHLCSNLCIGYIIFVSGVSNAVGNLAGCIAVTFLLHYFLLVSWFWMGIYSYELYIDIVKLFDTYRNRFITKATALCYGMAALICLLTFVLSSEINLNSEDFIFDSAGNYHAENVCWLTNHGLYFGFMLPVGLVLLFNLIIFLIVMTKLKNKDKVRAELKHTKKRDKSLFSIAFTTTFIIGLTWIFGYFLLFATSDILYTVINWIFAVSTSLQGFAIFCLTILRREDMRKAWYNSIRKCCGCQSYHIQHSAGGSSSGGKLTLYRNSRSKISLYRQKSSSVQIRENSL